MSNQPIPSKRRLQIVVKESACPGLIADLGQLPQGCENLFIRAVLTEWFLANANEPEAANRLVESYRTMEFRNENGIRHGNDAKVGRPIPGFASPTGQAIQKPMEERAVRQMYHARKFIPAREIPAVVLPLQGSSVDAPAATRPAPAPAADVDFDPDMF